MEIPDSDEAVQGAGGCECACRVNTDRDNPQSVTGVCVRILDHWGFILDGPNFHTLIDRSSDALAFVWYPGCTPEGIIVGILMLVQKIQPRSPHCDAELTVGQRTMLRCPCLTGTPKGSFTHSVNG